MVEQGMEYCESTSGESVNEKLSINQQRLFYSILLPWRKDILLQQKRDKQLISAETKGRSNGVELVEN
jgi:hypothetical protein